MNISPPEIRALINEFAQLASMHAMSSIRDITSLEQALDALAFAYHFVGEYDDLIDDSENESPTTDYYRIREAVVTRFPSFGYYYVANPNSDLYQPAEILIADAVDDLTDIIQDLLEVEWYWSNTSENDALWHFRFGYENHWGKHLRELQVYLYAEIDRLI